MTAQDDSPMAEIGHDPYENAVSHYSSPGRHDYVRKAWEHPQFIGLLDRSLRFLAACDQDLDTAHVTDIGAGSGEGYELLVSARDRLAGECSLHYCALDSSAALLDLMRNSLHSRAAGRDTVSFIHDDVRRTDFRTLPANLYLSIGAPFSHLTEDEMASVLENVGTAVRDRTRATVLILDVLGRYSVEWLPLAQLRRREYSMSFFGGTAEPPTVEMTFYSSDDLRRLVRESLPTEAISRLRSLEFYDRSVFVGWHTSTRQYNPSVPPIRRIVNELALAHTCPGELLGDLLVPEDAISGDGQHRPPPQTVHTALSDKSEAWNSAVRAAMARPDTAVELCDTLRRVDQAGPGLGLGHSLTAVLHFRPQA